MMKNLALLTGLIFLSSLHVHAFEIDIDKTALCSAEGTNLFPKNNFLSYSTISKLETLFLKILELYGTIDSDGEVFLDADYQFNISGSDETDYGARSYDVDIDIDSVTFKNFTADTDPDFELREETESDLLFSKQIKICGDYIVLKGEVNANQYAFTRNDNPLPENDNETGFFDRYSFYASGYSNAELVLQGETCLPIDINIRIDPQTVKETYEHEISPGYREDEVVEGVPKTELIDPVFTEAVFEGISIPVFLIPEEYAATVIAGAVHCQIATDCQMVLVDYDGSGPGDWRLPNLKELQSLIDFEKNDPALPSGHPFYNVQSQNYWTGTTHSYFSFYAWFVNVLDGVVNFTYKDTSYYLVWCVRGSN